MTSGLQNMEDDFVTKLETKVGYDPKTDTAAILLEKAKAIVTGARRKAYGNPEDNFRVIRDFWTTFLERRLGVIMRDPAGVPLLGSSDIAVMMELVKVARLAETPDHADSHVDIAGYAACAARAAGCEIRPEP